MLAVLAQIEAELPDLLADEARWQSLDINYHPPFVERLWTTWDEYRVSLHRIHPCKASAALFHPHPWPSAMRILDGRYEMAIGYGKGSEPPPIAARFIAAADVRYEMTDPDAWHYVRPLERPAMTIMVTGRPWKRESPPVGRQLSPLDPQRSAELMEWFRGAFPRGMLGA